MKLIGTTALVTGANRGIGASLVEALVAAGASRVYAGMRKPHPVPTGSKVIPFPLDVTSADQIAAAARQCSDVQVLINNAGILSGQPLLHPADREAAQREMQVNFFGTLEMCRAFAPVLAGNGGGAVVNILSILARVSIPGAGSYSASKAAAYSLTQSIRAELAGQGTLVIGVMPGFVDTDMVRTVSAPKITPREVAQRVIEALGEGIEDVYPGRAADIAEALRQDPKAVERQFAAMRP
jgi:NAD(P)-dependent dehydrogenase (short-subunit alcohol dehydrogenase family)